MRVKRRVENVRVRRWYAVENGFREAEVLCQDGLGGMRDPVVDVEGGANTGGRSALTPGSTT